MHVRTLTTVAALAAALLAACMDDQVAGTSTETVTGKTTGFIYLADGKPARGARVRVLPVDYRPLADSGAATAFRITTDDEGRYLLDSLNPGEYNILSELDGESAFRDSVFLSGTARTLPSDTLEEPGTVCGFVALQPGDLPAAATVQVLGTHAYANVEDNGFFSLPPLAPGLYRAAVDADLPGYTTHYLSLRVHSGRRDTLPETLAPRFTGIPLVTGLAAAFDTLEQAVTLTWDPSRFPNLESYVVLRRPKGSIQGLYVLAVVESTTYVDRLAAQTEPFNPWNAPAADAYEYRVAIKDKREALGHTFGGVLVATPPPSAAATSINLRRVNTRDGLASIGDTAYLVAEYRSPSRGLKQLRWFRDGESEPVRTVLAPPREGADTLVYFCPMVPSSQAFRVEIADDGGAEWKKTGSITVLHDSPTIRMTPNVIGHSGDSLALHADVADGLGRIVKIEWDFGGTGNWTSTLSNDTVAILPLKGVLAYPYIARVTDDDGLTATDTTLVYVAPWIPQTDAPFPSLGQPAVTVGDQIYLLGATQSQPQSRVLNFNPKDGRWQNRKDMLDRRGNFAAVEMGGHIYVFGGKDAGGRAIARSEVYDSGTDQWTALPAMPGVRMDHAAFVWGGRIYVLGGEARRADGGGDRMKAVDVFDPATTSWASFETAIPFELEMKAVVASGEVYVFSQWMGRNGQYARFAPETNTWSALDTLPFARADNSLLAYFGVQAVAGRIVVAGGILGDRWIYDNVLNTWRRPISNLVRSLDPATGKWSELFPMTISKVAPTLAAVGSDLFILGGGVWSNGGLAPTPEVEKYVGME